MDEVTDRTSVGKLVCSGFTDSGVLHLAVRQRVYRSLSAVHQKSGTNLTAPDPAHLYRSAGWSRGYYGGDSRNL
jgi:hypothetical protein